ncbi:unnamed protein product [Rotaria sordida]|uniref:Uncharacterized protein n=1 Tax=Rotaria sordida TaxID=392033 RepID=A0A813WF09_9BILA|nr:unnamed protein product [Rotaria sordida]
MKSISIIAIAVFALIALCSSAPVANQQAELQSRIDIYNDFLAGLLSNLVQTTFGSVSNFVNQIITENPLGVGKREVDQARIDIYNDFLVGLFSNLVQTTFGSVSNLVNQLITENPLGIGKRDVESDLDGRIDVGAVGNFLYDNILQQLFSGLVSNTFNTAANALTNLIQTNPLGVGKRDVESDLDGRIDIGAVGNFLYDNILQQLFSGLVSNTFNTASNTLINLIQTNPLGVGKRAIGNKSQ